MKYLTKALELSKKYRFFSKWEAMIPLFREKDSNIVITLFLAESFSHNRCYQLNVSINKGSGEIINKVDGFFKLSDTDFIDKLLSINKN